MMTDELISLVLFIVLLEPRCLTKDLRKFIETNN